MEYSNIPKTIGRKENNPTPHLRIIGLYVKNMRKMDFRMERPGLVKPGDHVDLKEDVANTMAGIMYYYTIREAIAMSNNTKQRLKSLEGTVTDVIEEEGIFTVWVEIPE